MLEIDLEVCRWKSTFLSIKQPNAIYHSLYRTRGCSDRMHWPVTELLLHSATCTSASTSSELALFVARLFVGPTQMSRSRSTSILLWTGSNDALQFWPGKLPSADDNHILLMIFNHFLLLNFCSSILKKRKLKFYSMAHFTVQLDQRPTTLKGCLAFSLRILPAIRGLHRKLRIWSYMTSAVNHTVYEFANRCLCKVALSQTGIHLQIGTFESDAQRRSLSYWNQKVS